MRATIARPKDACPSSATAATLPAPAGTDRHARRLRFALPLALALGAALAAAMLGALAPSSVLGGTSLDARCDGAALRSKPSSSSHREARLPRDARVVATKVVKGGHWKTRCAGSDDGRKWYRVVSVNGKAVSRLYGQKAVYGARSLFDVVYVPLQAACGGVRLRTDTHTSAKTKIKLPAGARVIASGTVSGGSWTADCDGRSRGNSWYRITKIGTQSVSSMFGVKALYAARGLLRSTAVEIPEPPDTSGFIEGIDVSHWQNTIAVARRGRGRQGVRVHEGVRGHQVRRPDLHHEPGAGERERDQGGRLPLRQARHAPATPWPRPTTSSRRRPGRPATCCPCSTSRSPAAWARPSCRPGPTFLDRVYAQTGERAMIYTSPNFWKTNMGDTTSFAAAGYRSLWVAHWTSAPAATVPGRQLGRDRLDVLAVHVERVGARHHGAGSTSIATGTPTSVASPSARRRPGLPSTGGHVA